MNTPAESEIRVELDKIVASPEFARCERLAQFLRFIVEEQLSGRGSHLKEYLIGVEVYRKSANYDPRLDSTVRVEATKLRKRLGEYYAAGGKDAAVRITVPKGGYHPTFECVQTSDSQPEERRLYRSTQIAPGFLLLLLLGGVIGYLLTVRQLARTNDNWEPPLVQVTSNRGWTSDPAISRDGRYIVYSSDHGGSVGRALWMQTLPKGDPVQLTDGSSDDTEPSISGDGKLIAFRSEARGGGVFVLELETKTKTLVASRGRNPRFSPTSNLIAYWVAGSEDTLTPGKTFIADASQLGQWASASVPVFPAFAHTFEPVWSDDGSKLLVYGTWVSNVPEKEYDAWVTSVKNGAPTGDPIKTGFFEVLQRSGITLAQRSQVVAGDWGAGYHYFSAPFGETTDVWRISLPERTARVRDKPHRLTSDTNRNTDPRISQFGQLVFSSNAHQSNIWTLRIGPGDADSEPIRLSNEPGLNLRPSISADGSALAWSSEQSSIMLFGFGNRKRSLTPGPEGAKTYPLLSPDGSQVAYRVMVGPAGSIKKQAIYIAPFSAGEQPRKVCADCGAPTSWSRDGSTILYETGGNPATIGQLDLRTGRYGDLTLHPTFGLHGARVGSKKDGWLAFYASTGPNTRQIFVTSFQGAHTLAPTSWIPVTDGMNMDYDPCWSPDGESLYFVSNRDGFRCIWSQRLHPQTKQAMGQPFGLAHFHSATRTLPGAMRSRDAVGLFAGGNRLAMSIEEMSANIWLSQLPRSDGGQH